LSIPGGASTDVDVTTPKGSKINFATEDIVAAFAGIVAVIIAVGIVFKTVDVTAGGVIIAGLVGTAGIAEIIKAKRGNGGSNSDSSNKPK
jgi:hypothetical protein